MENLDKLSDIFKALADPTRLRILKMLNDQEGMLCVNAITNRLDVTQSAVSQHLRILRQVGLVRSERRGYFIHYEINKETLQQLDEMQKQMFKF